MCGCSSNIAVLSPGKKAILSLPQKRGITSCLTGGGFKTATIIYMIIVSYFFTSRASSSSFEIVLSFSK